MNLISSSINQLKKNGLLIKNVLNHTLEKCLIAVKQNGKAIIYIKKPNDQIALEAVKQNGLVLEYIKNQNEKICLDAIYQNSMALQFVKYQKEDMIINACKKNPFTVTMIKNPTEELYGKIFINNVQTFKYMNIKMMTENFINTLWEKSIEKNGLLLEKCPWQTMNLCEIAIKQNPLAIKFINHVLFNQSQINQLYIVAVLIDGMVIEFIKNPRYDVAKIAIMQNKDAISKIKNNFLKSILHIKIDECDICYSKISKFTMFKCYHFYCNNCACKLDKCPSCRENVDNAWCFTIN